MLKPLGIHVLIEPLEEESAFKLPSQSEGQAEKGVVRGVGSEVEVGVKEGDTVIFRKYSPEEFELHGEVVYLIEAQDLMAIEYES